jgi:DNA polymerase-1
MAFPTRTALGAMIRRCFVAAEGYTIVSVDASQIELRTMAHHCRDRRMRGAFENNEDLHALTASIIFRIPLDKVTKVQRYVAKTLNFAIMYGISAKALLEQMFKADIFDYTLDDCKRFISEWFKIYGSVRIFLESVWKSAEKNGYVRDMWGRIAYVPNLRVGDDQMREAARRLAGNMPIQGGARGWSSGPRRDATTGSASRGCTRTTWSAHGWISTMRWISRLGRTTRRRSPGKW